MLPVQNFKLLFLHKSNNEESYYIEFSITKSDQRYYELQYWKSSKSVNSGAFFLESPITNGNIYNLLACEFNKIKSSVEVDYIFKSVATEQTFELISRDDMLKIFGNSIIDDKF